jgi:lysine 2,3-aminomutase
MDPSDPECPIRKQAIPHNDEFVAITDADVDPVGDRLYRRTNRVIHKYPDRIVFLVTAKCPVYCRHCTRKYHTTDVAGTYFAERESNPIDEDLEYIRNHPEIRDVTLSGGDPLSYHDHQLEHIIGSIRAIPHIEIIRIGSRLPVLLPQRITPELCAVFDRHGPIWVNTHFNHPREITTQAAAACDELLRHGVPVGNQTVLLKGVNDDVETMRRLCTELVRIKVRPYYLYHCDHVRGVTHFETSLEKGLEIMEGLVGFITGFAIPQYVLTTKIGKIPLNPDYAVRTADGLQVRNWRNDVYLVPWQI